MDFYDYDLRKIEMVILPVGPVYQYRRFIYLCRKRPIDLSRLYCFFMDEYLDKDKKLIDVNHPLSFRGFINREFIEPMPVDMNLRKKNIFFPDPDNLSDYDNRLSTLGNANICFAGVGINGHIAFNEPPEKNESTSDDDFCDQPTRIIKLSRETITINSNTALGGAYEKVLEFAITIGFRQILDSKKIRIYLNRPWQSSVLRKLLFGNKSRAFPASLTRNHSDVRLIFIRSLSDRLTFVLK